jgi:PAS domain S-box-containing protein
MLVLSARDDLPALLETLGTNAFAVDVDEDAFRYAGANRRHQALTGLAPVAGKRPDELWPEPVAVAFERHFRECAQSGETVEFLLRRDDRTGSAWWEVVLIPMIDGGRVVRLMGTLIDVTARIRAERALQMAEANLTAVFRATTNPIAIMDLGGKILLANEAAAQRFGMEPQELTGRHYWDFAPHDEHAAIAERIGEAIAGRRLVGFDTRFGDRVFHDVVCPVMEAGGMGGRLVGCAADITEDRLAARALARREAILEAVLLAANRFLADGAWSDSIDEVLARLGQAAEADRTFLVRNSIGPDGTLRLNQTHEWAAPGMATLIDNPMMIDLPYDAGGLGRWKRKLGQGEPVLDSLEWLPRDAAGSLTPQGMRSLAVMPLIVGNEWWGCLGFEDAEPDRQWQKAEVDALLTAGKTLSAALLRQKIDQELRASDERYKLAVGAGPVTIFDRRLDTRQVFLSPEFKAKLGYAPGELSDDEADWRRLVDPDDLIEAQASLERYLSGEAPRYEAELRMRHKDGSVHWFVIRAVAVEWDDLGHPVALTGTQTDITERKLTEEALRERSDALARAYEELRSFTYIVSHDLKAPLITIEGFVGELSIEFDQLLSLMGQGASPTSPEVASSRGRVDKAMGFVNQAVTTMNGRLGAILRLSRLGHRQFHPERIDVAELVQGCLHSLSYQLKAQATDVEVGPLAPIVTDREALEMVFGNLLSNAVKYLEPGRPGRIEVTSRSVADGVLYEVRDNGRGIAEKDLQRVFEIFRRAGDTSIAGEGVGLTFARTAIRLCGGDLRVRSKLGEGSTFSFWLPNTPDQAQDGAAAATPGSGR